MTRYIDADLLMEKKIHHCETYDTFDYDYVTTDDIDDAPTADVVEVVRCRDCRSGCPEIMNNNGKIEVHYYCDEDGFYHSGDYYCADGERWGNDG